MSKDTESAGKQVIDGVLRREALHKEYIQAKWDVLKSLGSLISVIFSFVLLIIAFLHYLRNEYPQATLDMTFVILAWLISRREGR
jgi:hypothetical protein